MYFCDRNILYFFYKNVTEYCSEVFNWQQVSINPDTKSFPKPLLVKLYCLYMATLGLAVLNWIIIA